MTTLSFSNSVRFVNATNLAQYPLNVIVDMEIVQPSWELYFSVSDDGLLVLAGNIAIPGEDFYYQVVGKSSKTYDNSPLELVGVKACGEELGNVGLVQLNAGHVLAGVILEPLMVALIKQGFKPPTPTEAGDVVCFWSPGSGKQEYDLLRAKRIFTGKTMTIESLEKVKELYTLDFANHTESVANIKKRVDNLLKVKKPIYSEGTYSSKKYGDIPLFGKVGAEAFEEMKKGYHIVTDESITVRQAVFVLSQIRLSNKGNPMWSLNSMIIGEAEPRPWGNPTQKRGVRCFADL